MATGTMGKTGATPVSAAVGTGIPPDPLAVPHLLAQSRGRRGGGQGREKARAALLRYFERQLAWLVRYHRGPVPEEDAWPVAILALLEVMDRVTVTADELPSVVTTRVIAALRKERAQMSPVSVGTSRAGRRALWSIRTNELDHTHRHQAPGPEDRLLEKELVGAVWRALAELGPLDQVLVVERYGLQGLAPARMVDIAAKHHLTIAAATKRLQRSLARLGGLLEPWAPDPGASSPLTCPWVPRPEEMAEARRRVAARLATAFIETQPPPDTLPSNRWYRKHIRPSHAELVQDIEQLLSAA